MKHFDLLSGDIASSSYISCEWPFKNSDSDRWAYEIVITAI